ncbi:MAG: transposase, partial [Actinomycetota bacterium]|nr:transposase [Actinomycetota bacterium]
RGPREGRPDAQQNLPNSPQPHPVAAKLLSEHQRHPYFRTHLEDDFEHLITYLRFPADRHGRIRHSNFIEPTFGETPRRVKVIGRLPGERSCLSLVWAVLDRASRGLRVGAHGLRGLTCTAPSGSTVAV